jgi:hypothetical protein
MPHYVISTLRGPLLVDHDIAHAFAARGFAPGFVTSDPYPWCVGADGTPVDRVHVVAVETAQYLGIWPRLPAGLHIHHRNENKLDSRLANLAVLTPAAHGRVHARRKANRPDPALRGFWRPPAHPSPVIRRPAPATSSTPADEKSLSGARWEPRVAELLVARLAGLRDDVGRLDSGQRIPRVTSNIGRSTVPGSPGVRLGLTDDEAALVGLLVLHHFASDAVLDDLGVAGLDRSSVAAVLHRMRQVPAVGVAIERWQKFKRLPRQLATREAVASTASLG